MSVYVDRLLVYPIPAGGQARRVATRNHGQWCHMWADDEDELHAMAKRIGLRRSWFQNHPRLQHYDLTASRRMLAVRAGALEMSAPPLKRVERK